MNCGTRNFSDDKFCGICKREINLSGNIQQKVTKQNLLKGSNFLFLIIIGLIIFIAYLIFHRETLIAINSEQISSPKYADHSNDSLKYNYKVSSEQNKINQLKYKILNIDLNNKRAFNVSVRINEKLSDDQLKALGMKVRSDISSISELGIIFFLLPKMKLNEGAWAAIDYKPEPFVRYIFGTSINDDKKMRIEGKNVKNSVGLWIDNDLGGLVIRIRKEKFEKYFFEYINLEDPKPSDLPIPLVKRIENGKIIYVDLDHPEEYYFINHFGDLLVIDKNGIVATYKKINRLVSAGSPARDSA